MMGRDKERCAPILLLKIDITACFNKLLRHGRMPFQGRDIQRRAPNLILVVDETARVA